MIIEQQKEAVKSNLNDVTNFKIEANSVMFKMLSSGIYQNKIKAVIRELSTNAVDAMVDSGTINDKQFEVHLPLALEPWFSIRDYGTGLDDEGIKRIYTYGASNRRDTNDYVGGFGIGSKSPFAYTKSGFQIKSYYNGICTTYGAYIVNGLPHIATISSKETVEENGIYIKINVDEDDFERFKRNAKEVYLWFDHQPKLNIDLDYSEYKKQEYNTFVFAYNISHTNRMVLMGNVLYNMPNFYDFKNNMKNKNKFTFFNSKIIFKVPVGTFKIQPSREWLELTDDFAEKMDAVVESAYNEYCEVVQHKVDNIKHDNVYDELLEFLELKHSDFYSCARYKSVLKIKPRLKNLIQILSKKNSKFLLPYMSTCIDKSIYREKYRKPDAYEYMNQIIIFDSTVSLNDMYSKYRSFIYVKVIKKWFTEHGIKKDDIKSYIKRTISKRFRCKEDRILFSSDIFPREKIVRKRLTEKMISPSLVIKNEYFYSRNYPESKSEAFDFLDPKKKYYYILIKSNKVKISDNLTLNIQFDLFKNGINKIVKYFVDSSIIENVNRVIYLKPAQYTKKGLEHPNYIDFMQFIKDNILKVDLNVYDEEEILKLNSYISNNHLNTIIKYDNLKFKSKLFLTIRETSNDMKHTFKKNYFMLELIKLITGITIQRKSLPKSLNEVINTYGDVYDEVRRLTSYNMTTSQILILDSLIHKLECYKDCQSKDDEISNT